MGRPAVYLLGANRLHIGELKKKDGDLKKLQLDAIAYLWEISHDLLLPKHDNVSTSPGFESLGLRVNNHKKERDPRNKCHGVATKNCTSRVFQCHN